VPKAIFLIFSKERKKLENRKIVQNLHFVRRPKEGRRLIATEIFSKPLDKRKTFCYNGYGTTSRVSHPLTTTVTDVIRASRSAGAFTPVVSTAQKSLLT
jgi:hypothetical protein